MTKTHQLSLLLLLATVLAVACDKEEEKGAPDPEVETSGTSTGDDTSSTSTTGDSSTGETSDWVPAETDFTSGLTGETGDTGEPEVDGITCSWVADRDTHKLIEVCSDACSLAWECHPGACARLTDDDSDRQCITLCDDQPCPGGQVCISIDSPDGVLDLCV